MTRHASAALNMNAMGHPSVFSIRILGMELRTVRSAASCGVLPKITRLSKQRLKSCESN